MMKNNTVDSCMGTWGMVLNPTKRYNVSFDQPFHLKQAVLDFNGFMKQELHFRVVLVDNNDDRPPLTICILGKQSMLQVPLDLFFEKGDNVAFFVKTDLYNMDVNSFTVHLSGVTTRDGEEVFIRQPTALSLSKSEHLLVKSRSCSLPDEYLRKKGIQSPTTKTAPPVEYPVDSPASATGPSSPPPKPSAVSTAIPEEAEPEPPASPAPKQLMRVKSKKISSKNGNAFFAKMGQLLSTSPPTNQPPTSNTSDVIQIAKETKTIKR